MNYNNPFQNNNTNSFNTFSNNTNKSNNQDTKQSYTKDIYNSSVQENMTPMPYLCKYSILDNLFKDLLESDKCFNIYFDTKNVIAQIHNPHEQQRLMQSFNNQSDPFILARSIIVLANHWMRYFKKHNKNCNIFFFDDRGTSTYHMGLSKTYKANRKIARHKIAIDLQLPKDFSDRFEYYYDQSILGLKKLFNITPSVFYFDLKDLESDFIPKFIIEEFYTSKGVKNENYYHILVGNDKDMLQLINDNRTYQFRKHFTDKEFTLISEDMVMEEFTKYENIQPYQLKSAKFIPLILALAGDTIDGIKGIYRQGYKSIYKYIDKLYQSKIITEEDYKAESFIFKIKEYSKINPSMMSDVLTKSILSNEDLILNNYKLTSFDEIYEWLPSNVRRKLKDNFSHENTSPNLLEQAYSSICLSSSSYNFLL